VDGPKAEPEMRITAIKRQKRKSDRVNVYVDGTFRVAVSAEVALQCGLRTGLAVTELELETLEARDESGRAREAGLRLLGHRPRTEHELKQRLTTRSFSPAAVAEAIRRIRAMGFIDDAAFARQFCEQRIRSRPVGARRLVRELRRKGVAESDAREAVDTALRESGVSDLDLAREALRKFSSRASEPLPNRRRRLQAFLARRGFSASTVNRIIRESEPG
jgi:regulatory protein